MSAPVESPSWTSHPAASSKSCPGVRIVTQTRRAAAPGQASPDLERLLRGQPVLVVPLAPT